jgi:WD40 repeat protein
VESDPEEDGVIAELRGHLHADTVKNVTFLGGDQGPYVASGSDDARVYVWQVQDSALVAALEAHSSTVNVVSAPPSVITSDGALLASAGLDDNCFIWAPLHDLRNEKSMKTMETHLKQVAAENKSKLCALLNPS